MKVGALAGENVLMKKVVAWADGNAIWKQKTAAVVSCE